MKDKKNKLLIFILCWLAYMATYICRLNFSAVMPNILDSNIFTKSQVANISSCFFVMYGIGQLINGFLGDKLNPRIMLFVGVFFSGLVNTVIFFSQNYPLMMTMWAINGIAQSMVWAPIVRIMGQYFEGKERDFFGANFTSAVPLGTLASYGVSLLVVLFLPWKYVFLVSGLIVIAIAIAWLILSVKPLNTLPKVQFNKSSDVNTTSKISVKSLMKIMVLSGVVAIFIPSAIHGILKDGVTNWVPTFIFETFDASTSLSLGLTMVLPIVNVTGAYLAVWLNKHIENELLTSAVFFIIALGALVTMLLFGKSSLVLTIICLALITNAMFAINTMIITFVPMQFAKYNRSSTVSGILNSVAYLGVGISNIITGNLLLKHSWNTIIIIWAAMAGVAMLISILIGFVWKKYLTKANKSDDIKYSN